MGKKKPNSGLGHSIIKDRFGGNRKNVKGNSFLHTTELDDGYDWGRLNLQSVTEESNLSDFLATAELAGTEFTAEKLNVSIVSQNTNGLPTIHERELSLTAQNEHRHILKIPRRPAWDASTTAEQLDQAERENFLKWRRSLAELQEVDHLVLTPFEKNLEFWRQLWRVVERSDIVVQIVDARNPLLFRCEDLESYVKEVDKKKVNMVLVNKADLLTEKQRYMWAEYFENINVKVAFWSAVAEAERNKLEEARQENSEELEEDESSDEDDESQSDVDNEGDEVSEILPEQQENMNNDRTSLSNPNIVNNDLNLDTNLSHFECDVERYSQNRLQSTGSAHSSQNPSDSDNRQCCMDEETSLEQMEPVETPFSSTDCERKGQLLGGMELIELWKSLVESQEPLTVGLVGYPNVGKSSTINAILQMKKVPVSATPGRTKHFQTLFVDPSVVLCDCPGLVMPTFVSTKADMVISGILPIDQMRDCVPPISLICQQIPKNVLESIYGILIPLPQDDVERPPTSYELLSSYAYMRGFMTAKGVPDCSRAARLILKDYVTGKLLYCTPPPGVSVTDFEPLGSLLESLHVAPTRQHDLDHTKPIGPGLKAKFASQSIARTVDKQFFNKQSVKIGTKGNYGPAGFSGAGVPTTASSSGSLQSLTGKPWKKHNNKHKKEKLRRIHAEFDA